MIDLSKYQFSIIYSVDVPKGVKLEDYRPPNFQKLKWDVTEGGKTEYDYLEGEWKGGKHRKYCNVLNFADFCEFLNHVDMVVEKCQTMGSLGAPGFGFGWAPAVPFHSNSSYAIQSAYVTPIPPQMVDEDPLLPGMPEGVDMPAWEGVEAAMWEWFDGGGYSAKDMTNRFRCGIL